MSKVAWSKSSDSRIHKKLRGYTAKEMNTFIVICITRVKYLLRPQYLYRYNKKVQEYLDFDMVSQLFWPNHLVVSENDHNQNDKF